MFLEVVGCSIGLDADGSLLAVALADMADGAARKNGAARARHDGRNGHDNPSTIVKVGVNVVFGHRDRTLEQG